MANNARLRRVVVHEIDSLPGPWPPRPIHLAEGRNRRISHPPGGRGAVIKGPVIFLNQGARRRTLLGPHTQPLSAPGRPGGGLCLLPPVRTTLRGELAAPWVTRGIARMVLGAECRVFQQGP